MSGYHLPLSPQYTQQCAQEAPLIQIPLTPDQFAAASTQLQEKQGIVLTGNEGKLSKMGVTASYVYKDGLLTVEILEKPFFVSTEYCEEQLRGFLGHKA